MWTDGEGFFYFGDCRVGDRAATENEIAEWEAAKASGPVQVDPVSKLQAFLAANPDVADLLK